MAADDKKKDAESTGKNERDRNKKAPAPPDRSGKPGELKITLSIRKALMNDKSLSFAAKYIKIFTANGRVTLRGPVETADEKEKISELAKAAARHAVVENQLEIKAAK